MWSEEDLMDIWKAGETVEAGTYIRIDNHSYRITILPQREQLPASCDGQVAWYALKPGHLPVENTWRKDVMSM